MADIYDEIADFINATEAGRDLPRDTIIRRTKEQHPDPTEAREWFAASRARARLITEGMRAVSLNYIRDMAPLPPTRRLPAEKVRVENGPLQFGDDWPGCFIRGDSAAYFAGVIAGAVERLGGELDPIAASSLRSLSKLLASCIA